MSHDEKKINFLRRYSKTILHSIFHGFSTGFGVALWSATYKILDIKGGEYPEMPKSQINEQYNEALPSIILDSVLICIAVTLLVSILSLFIRFKYNHEINIFREFINFCKKRK